MRRILSGRARLVAAGLAALALISTITYTATRLGSRHAASETTSTSPPARGTSQPPTTTTAATTTGAPVSTATSPTESAGVPAAVVASDGSSPVTTYNGPSSGPLAFGERAKVAAGTPVTVVCAVYGQPMNLNGATNRLWDFTTTGWLNDQLVETHSSGPVVPACVGSVSSPVPGSAPPSASLGPFPVIADNAALAVRSAPTSSAAAVGSLHDGDLVLLICSVHGEFSLAPQRLRDAGSNDQWDRIALGSGWVPDSNIDSHTAGSAAPAC